MVDLVPAEGRILEQILDASYELWHSGLKRPQYGRVWQAQTRTPWGGSHLRWWALVDQGQVLASAKEYDLTAVLDGQPIRVVGVGAVFTQPVHRGRGHANALVEQLIARAARGGADLALLFSEIGAPFYERLGFSTLPTVELELTVAQSERYGAPATMVRVGDDRDLDGIVRMNRIRAERSRFYLERDRDMIKHAMIKARLVAGFGRAGAREMQFFIAEEGASGVAYVVLTVQPARAAAHPGARVARDIWTIEECGDRDPDGARVGAILQVLLARDPAAPRPTIRGWLPPGFVPPQLTVAATRPSAEVMMVRPLTPVADSARNLAVNDIFYFRGDLF